MRRLAVAVLLAVLVSATAGCGGQSDNGERLDALERQAEYVYSVFGLQEPGPDWTPAPAPTIRSLEPPEALNGVLSVSHLTLTPAEGLYVGGSLLGVVENVATDPVDVAWVWFEAFDSEDVLVYRGGTSLCRRLDPGERCGFTMPCDPASWDSWSRYEMTFDQTCFWFKRSADLEVTGQYRAEDEGMIVVTLHNTSDRTVEGVEVSAVGYDSEGRIIGWGRAIDLNHLYGEIGPDMQERFYVKFDGYTYRTALANLASYEIFFTGSESE